MVIRNHERLTEEFDHSGEDIDILCDNKGSIIRKLSLVPRHSKDTGVHYCYKCGDRTIKIDLWSCDSGYYDLPWSKNIIENRVLYNDSIYVPDAKNGFYMLLYHILIHKKELPEKYKRVILEMGCLTDSRDVCYRRDSLLYMLTSFMNENNYKFTYNEYPLAVLNFDGVPKEMIRPDKKRKLKSSVSWRINGIKVRILSLIKKGDKRR